MQLALEHRKLLSSLVHLDKMVAYSSVVHGTEVRLVSKWEQNMLDAKS